MSESNPESSPANNRTAVDQLYLELMFRMGPEWRLKRAFSLSQEMLEAVRFQIAQENPNLSAIEIKIKAAEKLYFSDPGARELLKQAK